MLTDDDIKALRSEFGDRFRNFTEEQWRDLAALLPPGSKGQARFFRMLEEQCRDLDALLPPGSKRRGRLFRMFKKQWRDLDARLPRGSKGRDRFFRMFAAAANYYWKHMASPRPVKDFRRQLATVIENLRANMDTLSKLAPGYVEELSKLRATIDALHERWCDLQDHADSYEGSTFHKREFILNALLLWDYCGGKIAYSRTAISNLPSGPLIRYLTFACSLVMGQRAPAKETLVAAIRDFRRLSENVVSGVKPTAET